VVKCPTYLAHKKSFYCTIIGWIDVGTGQKSVGDMSSFMKNTGTVNIKVSNKM
jgi:hypothetical protein